MNLCRQSLAVLLVATFLTAQYAYAKPKIINAPSSQMTVRQARKALVESLNHLQGIESVQEAKFNRRIITYTGYIKQYSGNTPIIGKPYHGSVSFPGIKNLSVETRSAWSLVQSNGQHLDLGASYAYFDSEHFAMMFVDAVLTLKEAALAPDTEEADFATFAASAKTWLETTPKPEMSEEARTFKVLAEDAFERKDFTGALDAFCKALDKYPRWPKGQYNAAVLAAEAEDYELAAHHMRRYLVLAPDAKDAAAAKDMLLLWQAKSKE